MKIAYFDYWTKGVGNFEALDAELQRRGHQTLLLNFGSWRGQVAAEETVRGIQCRDITYYKTRWIYEMLRMERPEVLVSLNTTYLQDRTMVMACRQLGIKTVFLMHGNRIWNDAEEDARYMANLETSYNSIFKKLLKGPKYLARVIPNFFYSALKTGNFSLQSLATVFSYFKNPARSSYYPPHPAELWHDKCLVYSVCESKYYLDIGYQNRAIKITGNPKYDSLLRRIQEHSFSMEKLPPALCTRLKSGGSYALVLDEALPETNSFGGWTNEYRDGFIRALGRRFFKEGLFLVVKAHPGSDLARLKRLENENIFVFQQEDLNDLVYFSKVCVVHTSTTVANCVLLDKPILQPTWGMSANLPAAYIKLGVSTAWRNLEDALDISLDRSKRDEFKREYITVLKPTAIESIVREIEN